MSPYAQHLAQARLDALNALIEALNEAEDPAEKRRCAVAILKAPDPCELDDEIEFDEDDEDDDDPTDPDDTESDDSDNDDSEADDADDEENEEDDAPSPPQRAGAYPPRATHATPAPSPTPSTPPRASENLSHILDLITPLQLPPPPLTPVQSLLARAGLPQTPIEIPSTAYRSGVLAPVSF